MNVGYLKNVIKNLPDDTPVFVACQGYCNYNFDRGQPFEETDTCVIVHDRKLFVIDDCAVDIGNGKTIQIQNYIKRIQFFFLLKT